MGKINFFPRNIINESQVNQKIICEQKNSAYGNNWVIDCENVYERKCGILDNADIIVKKISSRL